MKKLIPVILLLALILSPVPRAALAQQLADPGVVKIKTDITRRLRDKKTDVTVRLRNGSELKGRITETAENRFILKETNKGRQHDLSYADVTQVKGRAVLLLRDVFDCDYDEIASVISKRTDTCRQLLRRARQHLASARARFEVSPEQLQKLARQFALTCASGDLKGLVTELV